MCSNCDYWGWEEQPCECICPVCLEGRSCKTHELVEVPMQPLDSLVELVKETK